MVRKVYFIESPSYLSLELDQIVIQREDKDKTTRPLDDAGQIIIDNPQVTISIPLLQACIQNQVSVIACDQKHLPCGIWLPLSGHSMTGGRTRAQLECPKPIHKQLWQKTIKSKISNQAKLLKKWNRPSETLEKLAGSVRSGDTTNAEATAASYYWKYWIVGQKSFKRDPAGEPPNQLLNFGYAILRSLTARHLMAAGLWPIYGMHHSNLYNHLPLADDVMEPFRPFVDQMVLEMMDSDPSIQQNFMIEKQEKLRLINISFSDVMIDGHVRPLQAALQQTCSSLAKCFEEKSAQHLVYPMLV